MNASEMNAHSLYAVKADVNGSSGPPDRAGFWDTLPQPARDALRRAGGTAMIKQGAFLTREHTRTAQVFVLLSGAAKVWVDRADGETAILDVLGPGDLAGELEAADGGARHANVEALTPVQALKLPAARFRAVLDGHPGAAWAVAAVLAERLRDANGLRAAHFPDAPERRLAGRLLRLAGRLGTPLEGTADGVEVRVPLSQQDLGRWAGMGRRRVARVLSSWPGLVEVARNRITVRSVAELRRLADSTPGEGGDGGDSEAAGDRRPGREDGQRPGGPDGEIGPG